MNSTTSTIRLQVERVVHDAVERSPIEGKWRRAVPTLERCLRDDWAMSAPLVGVDPAVSNSGSEQSALAVAVGVVGFIAWCFRLWDERPPACGACGERYRHADACPVVRRAREAPLVALVANVPEGLNAVGWRAAVLAVNEACGGRLYCILFRASEEEPSAPKDVPGEEVSIERQLREGRAGTSAGYPAIEAYQRAIAPPCPRRAPFCRKSPGLPLDLGEG